MTTKIKRNKVKNILFDLGNVLIDLDEELWDSQMRRLLRLPVSEAYPEDFIERSNAYERGEVETANFINHMLRIAGPSVQAREAIQAWNSMLIGIRYHRLQMLQDLRRKYKLYVLSNTNELHLEWVDKFLMKRLKYPAFYSMFNELFFSHEIKERKPDPEAWQHVMEMTGIRADETLYFDDKSSNIDAAAKLGFMTYQVPPSVEIADIIKKLKL